MRSPRRQLLALEIPFGLLAAAAVAAACVFASLGIPSWVPAAPLVRLGVASPLSGMTRSFVAVASGDLAEAFNWHPLGPMLFVVCLATPVVAAASWVRGNRLAIVARVVRSTAAWSVAAALLVVAWARQIVVLS